MSNNVSKRSIRRSASADRGYKTDCSVRLDGGYHNSQGSLRQAKLAMAETAEDVQDSLDSFSLRFSRGHTSPPYNTPYPIQTYSLHCIPVRPYTPELGDTYHVDDSCPLGSLDGRNIEVRLTSRAHVDALVLPR